MKIQPFLICALFVGVCGGAADAASYDGSWPVTITQSNHSNGTYCLTLNGGAASLSGGAFGDLPYGNFIVLNHLLLATVSEPLGTGQNAGLVFTAPARKGSLGAGAYVQDYGGFENDAGVLTIGAKNGC